MHRRQAALLRTQRRQLAALGTPQPEPVLMQFCSVPENRGWEEHKQANHEGRLEKQEQEFEEKLKQVFTQDICQYVAGLDSKEDDDDEDDPEEEEDGGMDYEEQLDIHMDTVQLYNQ